MLRLFATHVLHELRKTTPAVLTCVTRRKVMSSSAYVFSCRHRSAFHCRLFNTGIPVRKDTTQPKPEQTEKREIIDLDKWKYVMRSQAALDEKQVPDEGEEEARAEDETVRESGEDLMDSLQATRDLVAMWRQAGKLVPEEITDEEVQTLAELTTKSSKKKYLKYLAIKESHKKARKEKQQQRRAEKEAFLEKRDPEREGDDQREQKVKNTFLMQFWSRSLDKLLGWNCAQAMIFGQPLVFDMSYESSMSRREVENTVSQLLKVEGENRRATQPFHLHFCNLQPGGAYKKELLKQYGAEVWDRLLLTSTDRQYIDLFPRESLVYLTADSPNVLRTFDHTKVYIIGALVDRSIQSGLSLANAKRLKLATARLPLDEFLRWETGAKNLTLDQMMSIVLVLKDTGNWEEALKFVPQRKHDGFVQQQTLKQAIQIRHKGVAYPGPGQDSDRSLSFGERNSSTCKSGDKGFLNSHKDSEFTGFTRERSRDRAGRSGYGEPGYGPAVTRIRTSLKTKIDGKKSTSRNKTVWWDDD
ncbi:hypothetical protein LDENG_00297340 [Lucifuga dentata]|nr:hypothetical protein LDENG_00297340 [Lucifuga dentata]